MCQGLNSHYFHIIGDIGDGHQPNSIGVYIPIIRIPIKGGMTIPNTRSLDPGSDDKINPKDCQVKNPLVIQGFSNFLGLKLK